MARIKSVAPFAALVAFALLYTAVAVMPASAASNDSDASLNFWVDAGTGAAATYADATSQFGWTDNVIGSASTTKVDASFSCPADSTGTYIFVAKRGTERQGKNNYLAYATGSFSPGSTTLLDPLMKLSATTNGIWKGATLKFIDQTANPLSFGVSCTKDNGLTTLWAAYRYITIVSQATGAWTADAAPSVSPGPTTTPTGSPSPSGTPTGTPSPTSTPTSTPTATPTPTETPLAPVRVNNPAWTFGAVVYHVNIRNFSQAGSIQGFRDQLPRLKKLGIKIVDFAPLTPISAGDKHLGNLGSPYSVDDYQAFNTDLGTGTEFRYLVDYMHSQGMRVIVGWNAQSTGWLNDWILNHPEWFVRVNGAIQSPSGTGNTDKALLDYSNTDMRRSMTNALKWWVTTYNIDGFDCVNASQVPSDFWDSAYANVSQIKSGTYWISDDDHTAALQQNSFGAGLATTLNTNLFNLKAGNLKVAEIASFIAKMSTTGNSGWAPMNYLTTDFSASAYGTETKIYGPLANAASLLTFTLPGNTYLFNGQETGSKVKLPLTDKGNLSWPGYPAATTIFKSFIALKAKNSALWTGPTQGSISGFQTGNANVLGFIRTNGTNQVVVLVNLSTKTVKNAKATFTSAPGRLFDLGTGKLLKLGTTFKYSLNAGTYKVFSTAAAK
jgi:hypothetical protein